MHFPLSTVSSASAFVPSPVLRSPHLAHSLAFKSDILMRERSVHGGGVMGLRAQMKTFEKGESKMGELKERRRQRIDQLPQKDEQRGQGKGGGEAGLERALISAIGGCGIFMFLWVFGPFPGSAYMGSDWQTGIVDWVYTNSPAAFLFQLVAPETMFTKYHEIGPAGGLVHAAPAAIWSILAPLQLSREGRSMLGRLGHKKAGQAMLALAAVAMVGFAIIDQSGLHADVHDFGGNGGPVAAWANSLGVLPLPFNLFGVRSLAAWFTFTGIAALVTVKKGDIAGHKRWAVLHVGSGLWVAAQRPLFTAFRMGQLAILGAGEGQYGMSQQAIGDAFFIAGYITTVSFIAACLWLGNRPVEALPFKREQ